MKIRNILTIAFVFAYSWLLLQIERSTFADPEMPLYIWIVGSLLAVSVIWAVWNLQLNVSRRQLSPKNDTDIEKKKREKIDTVLRDMSSADLLTLKRRLIDAEVEEIVDEGELKNGAYKR